jgi:hypothetical protein
LRKREQKQNEITSACETCVTIAKVEEKEAKSEVLVKTQVPFFLVCQCKDFQVEGIVQRTVLFCTKLIDFVNNFLMIAESPSLARYGGVVQSWK